jgi:hypothetical protein
MKYTDQQIKDQLNKEADSFEIPSINMEHAKAQLLKNKAEEKNAKKRHPALIGGLSAVLACSIAAGVIFLSPVRDMIFPTDATMNYIAVEITDEDKQLASQTLLNAVLLSTEEDSSTALSDASTESDSFTTETKTISVLTRYLPAVEISFLSQDFTCTKTVTSETSYNLNVEGELLGGEEMKKSLSFSEVSSADGSVSFKGQGEVFSSPFSVEATRTKEGDRAHFDTTIGNSKGNQKGKESRDDESTYYLETSDGQVSFSLGKKDQMNAVRLSYTYQNQNLSYLFLRGREENTIDVISSMRQQGMNSFTIKVDNSTSASSYVIKSNDFNYSCSRSTPKI